MAITFDDDLEVFAIYTENTTYAFQLREQRPLHLFWGEGHLLPADLPIDEQVASHRHEESVRVERHKEEFAAAGGYQFGQPSLKVQFEDGVRDLDLRFSSWSSEATTADSETLVVSLRDAHYPVTVQLYYRTYADSDLIDRWTVIDTGVPLTVEAVMSASWYPRGGRGHRLTHLSGRWGAEHRIERLPLTQTRVVLDSRHGVSGHDANPWFAIDEAGAATEETGRVWFGALHWSGNWMITVEQDRWDQVRVTGGYNTFDFQTRLGPGEQHTTPVFTGGFTTGGFGAASRMLHRYHRSRLLPKHWAAQARPVIFNSWEVFWFDINAGQQMRLAELAAQAGAEVFVVDDGWFRGRHDDTAGLGDWEPDPNKFPEGLLPLSREVQRLGMTFGLWVEPEMISRDSDLYRDRPDWTIGFPTREGTEVRNQLVLNLARDDVREWTATWLTRLIRDNEIGYLKWDMNRYITEPGYLGASGQDTRLWIDYVRNLYAVFAQLKETFPSLLIENCCSGGGRADFGLAPYTDLVSRSDNGDALDMLKLHEGYTQAYAPITAGGGIGENPNGINGRIAPLTYRAHAGMLGAFHISVNLTTMRGDEFEKLVELVRVYKSIREIVHFGDLHRVASAWEGPYAVYQYVTPDRDRSVVLAFGQALQFQHIIPAQRLRGLDPDATYDVEGYKPMTGRALMSLGLPLELRGDFDSRLVRIDRVGT